MAGGQMAVGATKMQNRKIFGRLARPAACPLRKPLWGTQTPPATQGFEMKGDFMFASASRHLPVAALAAALLAPAVQAETIYALTSDNRITRFNAATPGIIQSDRAITGLADGETLLGMDRRPIDKQLYALGSSGNLYRLTNGATSYTATNLGALGTALSGNSFGVDFNPTVDRIRVVSDANQNLRINGNVMPPGTLVDGSLTLDGQAPFDLLAAAYTNSRPGAMTTMLFGIDARTGGLVRSTNANAGTYVTTNLMGIAYESLGLQLDNAQAVGFDISGNTGRGYFNFNNDLYRIDLNSGTPTLLGAAGGGNIIGLAAGAVPEPASWAMLITGFGLVGAMRRRQRRPARAAA